MRHHNLSSCVVAAFMLPGFGIAVQAQTFPSYIVDAQVPIVSSDGFNDPQGLALAPGRTVYVADNGNHRVLKFARDGSRTVVSFGALRPVVNTPGGVALDGAGDLYVTDVATNRLIKLTPGAANGLAIIGGSILNQPVAVASDAAGNLAIVNAGNANITARRYGGSAFVFNTGSTVLIAPKAVAFDNQGMLYVADGGNATTPPAVYRFPKLGGTGVSLTPAGYGLKNVTGLALDDQRNLYILDGGEQQLIEIPVNGGAAFLIPQSNFKSPSGLALDNLGNIYVSDSGAASNTVTEFVYHNAANFGQLQIGATSNATTFNYEFYERTIVEEIRGIGGGGGTGEYRKVPGGTCTLRTYYPSTSSTGLMLPAACTVMLSFTPTFPGGRPGAVQLQTSNGNENQLTIGTGMGAQLALMNAAIIPKFGSIHISGPIAVNAAATEIYFCAAGGTYKVPIGGSTPTLVTPLKGVSIALNGVGDLFIFNPPTITKIPADGSASTEIKVSGLFVPQEMVMDSNGAFYIGDLGATPEPPDYNATPFVLRVSSTGVTSKLNLWVFPYLMTADDQGDIYVEDGDARLLYEVPAWTGDFTSSVVGPFMGGLLGTDPENFAVDASNTIYFWDTFINANLDGMAYTPPSGQLGPYGSSYEADESQLPLYTIPPLPSLEESYTFVPLYSAFGNQTMATSANGKLYVVNGQGNGVSLVDRTQGRIPEQAFNPANSYVTFGNTTQAFFLYNVGNQNATFTDPTRMFTESGNGVGSFTFTIPPPPPPPPPGFPAGVQVCMPGAVIAPGDYCAMYVTNTNGLKNKGPIVSDTLHFLTDAVNNNLVSFKISGVANPAP